MLPIYKRAVDLLETVSGKKTEQAEQEPVAWMWACTECGTEAEDGTDGRICSSCGYHKFYKAPKDTAYVCEARAQEQAEQEPVAFLTVGEFGGVSVSITSNAPVDVGRYPLYAAPVRTKDLTDEEIDEIPFNRVSDDPLLEYARAVIAKDRRKNRV